MSSLFDQWEEESRYPIPYVLSEWFDTSLAWTWTDYVQPRGDWGIHRRRVRTAAVQKRRLANKAARKARKASR